MTSAAWLVARRALLDRPWRSALLLLGYGTGVAIMIALLSVGDALLLQARDRNLVAGGDVVVLPEGIDPAVIKINGVTGLFLTIPNARFLVRDVIGGPRFNSGVIAAAPQLSSRLLYVRAHGRVVPASASAGIPSLDREAHAARAVTGDTDSAADRAWIDPPATSLADRLDRFHAVPPPATGTGGPASRPPEPAAWAEWDYFNIIDPRSGTYAYLTLLVGSEGQGAVIGRVRRPGMPVEDVVIPSRIEKGDISTSSAHQHVGPARVEVDAGGYRVTVNDPRLRVDVRVRPDRGFTLPATERRQAGTISGYVVPMVRGRADGVIRTARETLTLSDAPAYHDHNWGTWRNVTWEWGEASSAAGALLYGDVHLPGPEAPPGGGHVATLFLWAAHTGVPQSGDRGGLIAALPITQIAYAGWRPGPVVAGRPVPAPAEVTIHADNGPDTVLVRIRVRDALGSQPLGAAGGPSDSRRAGASSATTQVFLQMRGDADLRGTIGGRPVAWQGPAASETFVRP